MLEKFISLKNIGRFVNLSSKGDVSLRKLTLIYGENGRGKTTLCSILRSLPKLPEQKKIGVVLNGLDKEIDLTNEYLSSLKFQKKGLMRKLLTGEVRTMISE